MRDIETRKDIEELVADFYQKAFSDRIIGYIFTDVARVNLDAHLPVIADFWEMILFGTVDFHEKYWRRPLAFEVEFDEKENLKLEHFARWVKLFAETVDAKFSGDNANLAKIRAFSFANTMRLKFRNGNPTEPPPSGLIPEAEAAEPKKKKIPSSLP
jgi:hemoglobin